MSQFKLVHIINFVVIAVDLIVAYVSFSNKDKRGRYLGYSLLSVAVLAISSELSMFTHNKLVFAWLSSIYYIFMAVMLLFLLYFSMVFTKPERTSFLHSSKLVRFLLQMWLILDIIMMLLNPYTEIAIKFFPTQSGPVKFEYMLLPFYWFHHALTYVFIAIIVVIYLKRSKSVPSVYKLQYLIPAFLFIVALLSKFLFLMDVTPTRFGHIDYLLIAYCVIAVILYVLCYHYPRLMLMTKFKSWMFDNIDRGIVLFDSDDCLISANDKAGIVMSSMVLSYGTTLNQFLGGLDISPRLINDYDNYSTLCYVRGFPVRCDYSVKRDKNDKITSRLFILSKSYSNTDILTGFYSSEYLKPRLSTVLPPSDKPVCIVTLDINRLSDINAVYGTERGDRAIKYLAAVMRQCFPSGTVFIRCLEAYLVALCPDMSREEGDRIIESVSKYMSDCRIINDPIHVVGTTTIEKDHGKIIETTRKSFVTLRNKKLMDRTSAHSEALYSLLSTLEQCDSDTGEHVQRTQKLCAELGTRLGLDDLDMSNLALLAMLHDIGKVGVPLEILNKPGALSNVEWEVLKTHVHKGYQIAMRSHELSGIADYILYHHERWDGRGYPEGLCGREIPLLSRIISIVDAYDAMSHNRSYRNALSEEKIRYELSNGSGTQFDPEILFEFQKILAANHYGTQKPANSDLDSIVNKVDGISPRASTSEPVSQSSEISLVASSRYVLDSKYNIIEIDKSFTEFTGYSADEAINMNQLDLIFPEEAEYYNTLVMEQMRKKGQCCLEHRIKCKDGSSKIVICTGKAFYHSALRKQCFEILISDLINTATVKASFTNVLLNNLKKDQIRNKYCFSDSKCRNTFDLLIQNNYNAMLICVNVDIPDSDNRDVKIQQVINGICDKLREIVRDKDIICQYDKDLLCILIFYEHRSNTDFVIKRAGYILDKIIDYNTDKHVLITAGCCVTDDNTISFDALLFKAKTQRMVVYCPDGTFESQYASKSRSSNYKPRVPMAR